MQTMDQMPAKWSWVTFLFFATIAVALTGCVPTEPVEVLPAELPDGAVGQSYSQTLTAAGQTPLTWTVASGALPAGLTLNQSAGTIAGTPTEAGSFDFVVAVRDAAFPPRTGEQAYTLTIIDALAVETDLPVARVNEVYSHSFAVTGGIEPYAFELLGLPAGLDFDEQSGTITGTPIRPKSDIPLQLTVTDSGTPAQQLMKMLTLTIKSEAVTITTTQLPAGTVGATYEATLSTNGGEAPFSWAVVAEVLPDGLRLDKDTGVISGQPTLVQTKTFQIKVTDSDEPATTDTAMLTIVVDD